MRIADAHCDTLYSIAIAGVSARNTKVTEETLRKGGVSLQTYAMFAGDAGPAGHPWENAQRMLARVADLRTPVFTGRLPEKMPDFPAGVLSVEGAEVFEGALERLYELDDRAHIRMVALTWNHENEVGYPAKGGPEKGLKPFGLELLKAMDARGILADVSHLNEAGFWDVVENAKLPPLASHSNCKAICPHFRNLTDEQIRALIRREGYMGINFYSCFLAEGRAATAEDVYTHIDRVAQMGGIGILGFGSDFDGISEWPEGLETPADFPRLTDMLLKRGYTEADVEAIAGGNLFNLLKRAEKALG